MPRESARARAITKCNILIQRCLFTQYLSIAYELDEEIIKYAGRFFVYKLKKILLSRYSLPKFQLMRRSRFNWFLNECSDKEFLRQFRMERESFTNLANLISGHSLFICKSDTKQMAEPYEQLLVFLKFVGTHGSDASANNLSSVFNIGIGSCVNYIYRVTTVLVSHYKTVVTWPKQNERVLISNRIKANYKFPNCIGIIDGTLLPLAYKPKLNGEDYYTRKSKYALHALICCDDYSRIIYALVGWPGSTHDNRVWENSAIYRNQAQCFSIPQYLLGDSAFRPSPHIIPPFKKLGGSTLKSEQNLFNTKLAKLRIKVEHSIGLLKARFQYFKELRVRIKKTEDITRIINILKATIVVHNLLINDPISVELQDDVNTVLRDELRLNIERNAILNNEPITELQNNTRRQQILEYLIESGAIAASTRVDCE